MDSGYGSALPTPVIAHMSKNGCAARSGLLNIGDHIISINGVNMVGMQVKVCIEQVKVRLKEVWDVELSTGSGAFLFNALNGSRST